MGLKITSLLHTDKGETSEMYLNIENIMLMKGGNHNLRINRYISKSERDAKPYERCECYQIPSNYSYNLTNDELSKTVIYELCYSKISEELIGKGFTVEIV